jgi:hypothetical protein
MREYNADLRKRKAEGGPIGPSGQVLSLPVSAANPEPAKPGAVEAGVQAEIEGLQQTSERPGVAQMALALARILDDPKAKSQQPAAAANLANLLDRLHKGADAKKSRLAAVRQMTSAKSATG